MILLVGLGNPGEKYSRHRHNVGFMAADAIADAHGFGEPRKKFKGEIREGFLSGTANGQTIREKATILKPQTFMNDSGQSVGAAASFYKLDPADVVVFYDELDLASGKLRVKTGGGAAGHNGIRSIDAHLGNGFRRVRIGIDHPGDKSKVTGHVLGNFSKSDQDWLVPMLDAIAAAAPFLANDDKRFATDVAQRVAPVTPYKKQSSRDAAAKEKSLMQGDRPGDIRQGDAKPVGGKSAEDAAKNPFAALGKLFSRKGD